MTKFAFTARAQLRTAVLSSLFLGLAACGTDGQSAASGAASAASDMAAADSTPGPVSTSVGVIDRTASTDSTSTSPATGTAVATNTVQSPAASAPAAVTAPVPVPVVADNGSAVASNINKPPVTVGGSAGSASGTTTLDWMPPTANSDGTVLTDLAGYTVYYGTAPDKMTQSVKLTNPGLTAYTITNLTSGKWYFSVTAYSKAGIESGRTGTVSTTI